MTVKAQMTLKQLYDTMVNRFANWRRNYGNAPRIVLTSITPYVGTKSLVFKFSVQSFQSYNTKAYTYGNKPSAKRKTPIRNYTVYIQFLGVEFSEKPKTTKYSKFDYKGKTYYYEKPNAFVNKARVRCNCMDFTHRFAWEDRAVGALFGGPPKAYTSKAKHKRGPVNPQHIPGICKHITAVLRFLERNHYIQ
jgi:hypothetical protein